MWDLEADTSMSHGPEPDLLDELEAEAETADPGFTEAYAAAQRRRAFLNTLAERRDLAGLTQAAVAQRMGTSQSAVARLERGEVDPHLSTLDRYAAAIGQRVTWTMAPPVSVGTVPTVATYFNTYLAQVREHVAEPMGAYLVRVGEQFAEIGKVVVTSPAGEPGSRASWNTLTSASGPRSREAGTTAAAAPEAWAEALASILRGQAEIAVKAEGDKAATAQKLAA